MRSDVILFVLLYMNVLDLAQGLNMWRVKPSSRSRIIFNQIRLIVEMSNSILCDLECNFNCEESLLNSNYMKKFIKSVKTLNIKVWYAVDIWLSCIDFSIMSCKRYLKFKLLLSYRIIKIKIKSMPCHQTFLLIPLFYHINSL